jgi:riboflavin synthase
VEEDSFAIWLIPHTLGKTNLKQRGEGDLINLEFDILAKYVEKFSAPVLEDLGS